MFFDLNIILNSFKLGDKMDKEKFAFLKNYDANNNSIFDIEDVEKLQKDLKKYSNEDNNDEDLTNKDILAFYNNAMSKISSEFKKISTNNSSDIMKTMFEWLNSNNNSDEVNNFHSNENYKTLEDFQKKVADKILKYSNLDCFFDNDIEKIISLAKKVKSQEDAELLESKIYEITLDDSYSSDINLVLTLCNLSDENYNKLKNSNVFENYEDYVLVDILEDAEDPARVVNIMSKNNLNKETILELSKLSPESEELALNIINQKDLFNGVDIAKTIDFKNVLPNDFYDNIDKYEIKKVVGDCISCSISNEEGIPVKTFMYDKEFGLYEIREFNAEENKETVCNLRTNTIELIEYADENKTIKKDIYTKYDSLKYDKTSETYDCGNIISTKTISQSQVENMYNITTYDSDGKQIYPSQYCSKNENGGLVISRDFVSPPPHEIKTSYHYEETTDNMQIIDYTITDKNGNIIMDRHQTMQIISDNKVITSINDKIYEAEFNNDIITITDKTTGNKKELNVGFITEGKELMYELLKTIPANLLIAMDSLPMTEMSFDENGDDEQIHNNARFSYAEHCIKIGHWDDLENKNLSTEKLVQYYVKAMIHEYGHFLDSYADNDEIGSISSNDNLRSIHDTELSALLQNSTTQEQNYLTHMIDDQYKKVNGKKENDYFESLAEAVAVFSGRPGTADFISNLQSKISLRESFIMQYFPQYIAGINAYIEQKYN